MESPLVVNDEPSSEEFSDKFDYVIIFPWHPEDQKWKSKEEFHILRMVRWITESGLETFPYLSVQNDELILLVRAPQALLEKFADDLDFKLPMDPDEIKKACEAGDLKNKIASFSINEGDEYCMFKAYEYIQGRFETNVDPKLYLKNDGKVIFSRPIRLKLVYYFLQAPRSAGGANIKIQRQIKQKRILAFYPLHNRERLEYLTESWVRGSYPWNQPLDEVRKYFGEKIGLYFAFMGHYTRSLLVPAVIGFIFQLVVWGTDDFSSKSSNEFLLLFTNNYNMHVAGPVLPFFSVLICVWTIYMLEMWKREEKCIALKW